MRVKIFIHPVVLAAVLLLAMEGIVWSAAAAPAAAPAAAAIVADPAKQALDLYAAALKSSTSLGAWQRLGQLQTSITDDSTRAAVRQIRAMLSSELGLYDEAVAEFPFATNKSVAAGPLPNAGYRAADAADVIARLARDQRVIIVNEAHHIPQTRALLLDLLPRLRKLGFTDYAAETLDVHVGAAIAQRGYAVRKDGVYSREPVFGQLLRTVAKLGYRIDSYEAEDAKSVQGRETAQAANLAKLLHDRPDARLIVHVGYAHVREAKTPERVRMAAELKRLTGIDPLTIDQTMFVADIPAARENPAYRSLLSRLPPNQVTAAVFVTKQGKPWSDEPGQYDVSVILPDPSTRHGRPGWLWMPPLRRQPVDGYTDLCRGSFPCAVSAHIVGESIDAVPADNVVLLKAADAPSLALPVGHYHLVATDTQDHALGERAVDVGVSAHDAVGNERSAAALSYQTKAH